MRSFTLSFLLFITFLTSFPTPSLAMEADDLEVALPPPSARAHRKHAVKSHCCCSCTGSCSSCCKRDSRYKVDPDDECYSVHAFITAYFPGEGWLRGTATNISPNCIVTAAHNLYRGEYATEVILVYQMRQVTKHRCCCISRSIENTMKAIATKPIFSIHPDFLRDPDSPHDIALLTLNKPSREDFSSSGVDFTRYANWYDQYEGVQVTSSRGNFIYGTAGSFSIGQQYGVLSMGLYSPEELIGSEITISGYPSHIKGSCRSVYNMYSAKGRIRGATDSVFLHDADTSYGESGSTICCLSGDGETEIVGVHVGEYNDSYNQAVPFNSSVLKFLEQHLLAFDRTWATTNLSISVDT